MPDTLIRNGNLFEGTGAPPRPRTSVLLGEDRIHGIGDEAEARARRHKDVRVIDASGQTVMPGLIDCHTHLTLGEARSNDEVFFHREQNYSAILAAWNAGKVLRAGVTSVLDADGIYWIGPALKEAIEAGLVEGPRMSVGGFALMTSVGGTAGKMIPDSGSAGYACVVRNRDEMVMETRREIKNGADWIKIHVTGIIPGRRGEHAVWTVDELKIVVDTAHDLGVPVIAHCRNAKATRDAARAGVDILAHCSFMDEEALDAVVTAGAAVLPTFTFLANLIDFGPKVGASASTIGLFRSEIEQSSAMIRRAFDAGVTILSGSESGFALTPYGHWHAREMEIFVKYLEMTPIEALATATGNARVAIRRDDLGTIADGLLADIIVVEGDPTRDIRVLQDRRRLKHVFKGGKEIDLARPWPQRTVFAKERVSQQSHEILTWDLAMSFADGTGSPESPEEELIGAYVSSCPCSM